MLSAMPSFLARSIVLPRLEAIEDDQVGEHVQFGDRVVGLHVDAF